MIVELLVEAWSFKVDGKLLIKIGSVMMVPFIKKNQVEYDQCLQHGEKFFYISLHMLLC